MTAAVSPEASNSTAVTRLGRGVISERAVTTSPGGVTVRVLVDDPKGVAAAGVAGVNALAEEIAGAS